MAGSVINIIVQRWLRDLHDRVDPVLLRPQRAVHPRNPSQSHHLRGATLRVLTGLAWWTSFSPWPSPCRGVLTKHGPGCQPGSSEEPMRPSMKEAEVRSVLARELQIRSSTPTRAIAEFWIPLSNERADLVLAGRLFEAFEDQESDRRPAPAAAPGGRLRTRLQSLQRSVSRASSGQRLATATALVGCARLPWLRGRLSHHP